MKGLIGKKIGMTQIFDEDGSSIPVTAIEAGPCGVTQLKSVEKDGYNAVQLGFDKQKEKRMTRPLAGHCKSAGGDCWKILREIRASEMDCKAGDLLTVEEFNEVPFVDVVGISKGQGYQGVVKRHGFSGGRASHGSGMHRQTGSIGQCEEPARVFKNRKMPGQSGSLRITTQNLKVEKIYPEDNIILIRGSVPGPKGAYLVIREALKKKVAATA